MFGSQQQQSTNQMFDVSSIQLYTKGNNPNGQFPFRSPHGYGRSRNNARFHNSSNYNELLQHWCETCDRGFKTSHQLESHKSEHQKCGIDGCKFIAHPKVVTKHIEMQHSSGLFTRIKKLETPEEISNWIKERKKNYPSKENIEKEKAAKKECMDRGEKLKDSKLRFNNRKRKNSDFKEKNIKFKHSKSPRNKDINVRNKNKFNQVNNKHSRRNDNMLGFDHKESDSRSYNNNLETNLMSCVKIIDPNDEENYCGIHVFRGTSDLEFYDEVSEETYIDKNNIEIEDDEWDENPTSISVKENSAVCKALSNLISAYQSSSDDENCEMDIKNEEKPNIVTNSAELNTNINGLCETVKFAKKEQAIKEIFDDNDSGPESTPIERSSTHFDNLKNDGDKGKKTLSESTGTNEKKRKHPEDNSTVKNSTRPSNIFQKQFQYYKERPSSLLEKLLEKDIRHERNIILQCINHIVNNDFYD